MGMGLDGDRPLKGPVPICRKSFAALG
jgi:hypothetical protein